MILACRRKKLDWASFFISVHIETEHPIIATMSNPLSASVPEPVTVANDSDLESVSKPQVIYRCKKCRRIVASVENIVSHERGKGEECFKWKKRSGDLQDKEPAECSSIFVEPMKWMQTGRFCGRETPVHGLQSTLGFLQLGRNAMQLWNMG